MNVLLISCTYSTNGEENYNYVTIATIFSHAKDHKPDSKGKNLHILGQSVADHKALIHKSIDKQFLLYPCKLYEY